MVERARVVEEWAEHQDEWTASEVTRRNGIQLLTLLGWRDELSDEKLAFVRKVPADSKRIRKSGADTKAKLKPYELRVLDFYTNCQRDGDHVRPKNIIIYCQNIPEFVVMKRVVK